MATPLEVTQSKTNWTLDVQLDPNTLNAYRNELEGLQTRVIETWDWSSMIEFANKWLSEDLKRAQMKAYEQILLSNPRKANEKYLVDDLFQKNPETVWAILDSGIFRKSSVKQQDWEAKVIYEPNINKLADFQNKLQDELVARHIAEFKTVQGSDTKQLDFWNFYNSDQNKIEYVQAFNNSLDKFLMQNYSFDAIYAKNIRNALVNFWSNQNKSAWTANEVTFITEINNPAKYSELVGQILNGPLSEKWKFWSLYENKYKMFWPNWQEWYKKSKEEYWYFWSLAHETKEWTLNALGLMFWKKNSESDTRQFTPEGRANAETLLKFWVWWVAIVLGWGKILRMRHAAKYWEDGDKKLTPEEQKKAKRKLTFWTIWAAAAWLGALAYSWMGENTKPSWVKSLQEWAFWKNKTETIRDTNTYSSLQLLWMMANWAWANSFTIWELQKYFETSVEFPQWYGFNFNRFINDYKDKVWSTPTSGQKQNLNTFANIAQLPKWEVNSTIVDWLRMLGVEVKNEDGKITLVWTNLQTPLLTSVNDFDSKPNPANWAEQLGSKAAILNALEGAKTMASGNNYPIGSKESSDAANFVANAWKMTGWLNQLNNWTASPDNIFAKQDQNFVNWKFRKDVFIQNIWEYWNLKEWNQLMNQLKPYLA